MIETLAPFFLHPAIAAAGAACAAVPVVIHLINRLRFRRVRFAAMEFLLASEQRNRRRVLIEQLLLLLLRILIVLAAGALIARLVLDPSTLSALRGGEAAHHVVVLDDSGSMRAVTGGETAFAAAKQTLRDFAAEAAREGGGIRMSVLLLSRAGADSALFARQDVTTAFLGDLSEKLDALEPTHARLRPAAGLDAAGRRLAGDEDVGERVVHLLSDFRAADWGGAADDAAGESAAAVARLDADGVRVNLVRVAGEAPPNLRVTGVAFGSPTAAVGVPVRVRASVENVSETAAEDVELAASLDGQVLPLGATVPTLEPGESAVREFDVQFDAPGRHAVRVEAPGAGGAGLDEDDGFARPLLVLPRVPVLVVDGTADLAGATLIARTFDADLTGRAVRVGGPDLLRKEDLSKYWTVYVLNVPRLPADAVGPLERYVRGGGGLIWYGGELDAGHYTDALHAAGLFPVPLAGPSKELPTNDGGGPDVRFRPHPVTEAVTAGENLFADLVTVDRYLPVPRDWNRDDAARDDGVETLADAAGRFAAGAGVVVGGRANPGGADDGVDGVDELAAEPGVPAVPVAGPGVGRPDRHRRRRRAGGGPADVRSRRRRVPAGRADRAAGRTLRHPHRDPAAGGGRDGPGRRPDDAGRTPPHRPLRGHGPAGRLRGPARHDRRRTGRPLDRPELPPRRGPPRPGDGERPDRTAQRNGERHHPRPRRRRLARRRRRRPGGPLVAAGGVVPAPRGGTVVGVSVRVPRMSMAARGASRGGNARPFLFDIDRPSACASGCQRRMP